MNKHCIYKIYFKLSTTFQLLTIIVMYHEHIIQQFHEHIMMIIKENVARIKCGKELMSTIIKKKNEKQLKMIIV